MNAKENPGTGGTVHGADEAKAGADLFEKDTTIPSKRQVVKRLVVWLAVAGIMPVAAAEWIIKWGGMADV